MKSCTNNTTLQLMTKKTPLAEVRKQFGVNNLWDITEDMFNGYLDWYASTNPFNKEKMLNIVTQNFIAYRESESRETIEPIEESTVSDVEETPVTPVSVQSNYTFASRSDALRTLFADQESALLAYENFISKHLINYFFLNLNKSRQITNTAQLRRDLFSYVNGLSKRIIGKDILEITPTEIVLLKTNYYELNAKVNELLSDSSRLASFVDDPKDPSKGLKNLSNKLDIARLVSAVTYANFNTILKEYLPGVLKVESDYNGFDVENRNNLSIYTLNSRTQPKGSGLDEDMIIDRNSALAKLLITSFSTVLVKKSKGVYTLDVESQPPMTLANYYFVVSQLSKHVDKTNYVNDFSRLLTAIVAYQIVDNQNQRKLSSLGSDIVGKYNVAYLDKAKDLQDLIKEVTHSSVIATLYYNLLLSDNDILFDSLIPSSISKKQFSLKKYYQQFSKDPDFDKNNLFDIIFATFAATAPRNYHDIAFSPKFNLMLAESLSQRFVNKHIFQTLKAHRYLEGRTIEIHNEYVKSVGENSLTLKVNGKEITYNYNNGWPQVLGIQETMQLYELFRQLTNIDLSQEVMLRNTDQFSKSNILSVVHAMLNLYNKSLTDDSIKRIIQKEMPLKNEWDKYSVVKDKKGGINALLYNMGFQHGKILGVFSKMTVLTKDGKALPTFSSTSMLYDYQNRLNFLRRANSETTSFTENNLFVLNDQLFRGVSSKNQIAKDGQMADYRSQNLKDQVLTDVLYEYFQRRNFVTDADSKESSNSDKTIHFQPVVYADKTMQMVIEIAAEGNFKYPLTKTTKGNINFDNTNNFTEPFIKEIQEATFFSLKNQYNKYFDHTVKALTRIAEEIIPGFEGRVQTDSEGYTYIDNVEDLSWYKSAEKPSDILNFLFESIQANLPEGESIETLWQEIIGEPLIHEMVLSKGKLNSTQLFYYDMFDVHKESTAIKNSYKNFMNLGVIQFLQNLSEMYVDQSNKSLGLFTNNEHPLMKDMNSILDPEIKKALMSLNEKIEKLVTSSVHNDLFNLDQLMLDSGITQEIETLLPKLSKVYQQFFWEKELFSHNFELSGNGPIFLHPVKKTGNTLYAELIERLSASQKRNVTYQGTTIPYTTNSLIGIPLKRKVLVFKDPQNFITNPLGESEKVKNHDGGEYILMLQRILENNSLPAYNNPKHHKAFIPGIVSDAQGNLTNAILFKYASYSLNNLRLRASLAYQNMVQTALSVPIVFLEKIDFTKDYNGNAINYGAYNLIFEDDALGLVKVKSLTRINESEYVQQLENIENGSTEERTLQISSLYDLYTLLGKHKSINFDRGIKTYTDDIWFVMADLANRVGFRLTQVDFHNGVQKNYARISTNKYEDLVQQQHDWVDTQLKVVQPLKLSFISNITPESCIKFGGPIGIDANSFETPIINAPSIDVSNLHQGIQQDTEHSTDKVTEVTQMINGMALDNMTPEHLSLYQDIANYVISSMGDHYTDFELLTDPVRFRDNDYFLQHVKQLVFIYKKLKNQVLNSNYNTGQTQSALLGTIANFVEKYTEEERKQLATNSKIDVDQLRLIFANEFRVPLSDQGVYNTFVTTLASINTKIGVRRKSAGEASVMAPNSTFMTYIKVPIITDGIYDNENYATLTSEQFKQHLKDHPEYSVLLDNRYTPVYSKKDGIGTFNLGIFNHYRINGGETIYVSNFYELKKLKNMLYAGEIDSLELDNLSGFMITDEKPTHPVGRPLKPIDFEVIVKSSTGKTRVYNIYDTVGTEFLFKLQDISKLYKNDPTQLQAELNVIKGELQQKNIPNIDETFLQPLSIKQLKNVLQKINNDEYIAITTGKRNLTVEDAKFLQLQNGDFTEEELKTVSSVNFIDAEIIMEYYNAAKFGINNTHSILDISQKNILDDVLKQVKEVDNVKLDKKKNVKAIEWYFNQPNGNVYLFQKNALKQSLEPLSDHFIKINDEGKRIVEFDPGKPLLEITPELEGNLYIARTDANKAVLMISYEKDLENSLSFWINLERNINKINGNHNHESQGLVQNVNSPEEPVDEMLVQALDAKPKYGLLSLGEGKDTKFFNTAKALAQAKHSSFLMSLRHASSRIPGQSYQSFSATRITNFLHDEQNTILVSDYNIWLTGGDYDIDKLYNMGYYLTPKGVFIGWNPMFNMNTYQHLKQSLNLPKVGMDIQIYNEENAPETAVKLTDEIDGLSVKQIFELNLNIKRETNKPQRLHNVGITNFKQFVKLYNLIVKNGIVLSPENSNIELMVKYLEAKDYEDSNLGKALENRIVKSTRDNLSDIRNITPSYSPISMEGPSDLKNNEKNTNAVTANLTHPYNPVAQPKAVFNQYAGKNVVGINAAGLKIYQTISYVVEKDLSSAKTQSVEDLKKMLFENTIVVDFRKQDGIDENGNSYKEGDPIIEVRNGFAGINYAFDAQKYAQQLAELQNQNKSLTEEEIKAILIDEIKKELIKDYRNDSVQLQISQMLSAATDNGKEMILGIINQGKETQGVYIYALTLGYTLEQIGEIMISEPINFILNQSKRSILLNEANRSMVSVIDYFYDKPNISHFIPPGAKKSLLDILGISAKDWDLLEARHIIAYMKDKEKQLERIAIEEQGDYYDEYIDFSFDDLFDSDDNTVYFNGNVALNNYLNVLEKVNKMKQDPLSLNKVKIFTKLLDGAALFAGTTQLLSANQAVPSTDREILQMIINFEDMIRNFVRAEKASDGVTGVEITYTDSGANAFQRGLLKEEIQLLINFDLREFFTNEAYANRAIEAFDKIKNDLNPLQLIYQAEHFREMIRTIINTDKLNSKYSVVYRTLKSFLTENVTKYFEPTSKKLPKINKDGLAESLVTMDQSNRKLSEPAFNILKNVVDDVFVHTSLIQLQKELKEIQKPIKIEHEGETGVIVNLGQMTAIGAGQVGRKEFVNFMEKIFIPRLKEGILGLGETSKSAIKNNQFVKALTLTDFRIRNKRGKYFSAYGIQIPKLSENFQEKIKQNELSKALYELKDYKYMFEINGTSFSGQSVVDLLFLYNLIVHRKKEGEFTLTAFFNPEKIPGSIVNKYNDHARQVDDTTLNGLSIQDQDLFTNGFDNTVDFKIKSEGQSFSDNYKYINIDNSLNQIALKLTKEADLIGKIQVLLETIGNPELSLKFECQ